MEQNIFFLRKELGLSKEEILELSLYEFNYLLRELGYYYQAQSGKKVNREKSRKVKPEQTLEYIKAMGFMTSGG